MAILVVAYSFALRKQEPNPCNVRIARETERIVTELRNAGEEVFIVAQWEVARQLERDGFTADLIVGLLPGNKYLGSAEVWSAAEEFGKSAGVTVAIAVAQPFLHLPMVRRMMRSSGWKVREVPIGKIGFDPSPLNTQWWTRGPKRLVLYSALTLVGYHGHAGQQAA